MVRGIAQQCVSNHEAEAFRALSLECVSFGLHSDLHAEASSS
jgi:hypothetical protein